MAFEDYSDEELMKIASGQESQSGDLSQYSDEELMKIAGQPPQEKSGGFVQGVVDVADAIDSVTGAPTRQSIRAFQKGEDPVSAFADQFGESPENAATGKEIASEYFDDQKPLGKIKGWQLLQGLNVISPGAGGILADYLSQNKKIAEMEFEPTAADLAGFGVDVAADPTWLVPFGLAPKAAKGVVGAGKAVAGPVVKGAFGLAKKAPVAGKAVEITGETIKSGANAVSKMFNPKLAPDYDKLVQIAEKNNIPKNLLPDSVEFGESSVITRAGRAKAEGPLGEDMLRKFEQAEDAVRGATKNIVSKIGGGNVPSRVEAGEILRDGYDKGLKKMFDQVDWSHKTFMGAFPGAELTEKAKSKVISKLNGLEKWAKGQAQRGITQTKRTQAEQILKAVENARNSKFTYKQIHEAMRDIGDVAFKTSGTAADIPPDIEKLRDLYFTIDDALLSTVDDLAGKEIGGLLRSNNEIVSDFLTEKSVISRVAGNRNLAPEKVFARLVENGDTRTIKALKNILPEENFKALKSGFLNTGFKENADGIWTFKGLYNRLRTKRDLMGALLEPGEVESLDEIITLGSRLGNPILSTSGTGASGVFRNIGAGVRDAVENDSAIEYLKSRARNNTQLEKVSRGELPPPPPRKTTVYEKAFAGSPAVNSISRFIENSANKNGEVKGRAKWTLDGMSKLMAFDGRVFDSVENVDLFLNNPNAKKLMQEASGLKPGSKRMKAIYKELEGMVDSAASD